MFYLIKKKDSYKVVEATCKNWQRWTKFSGGSHYEYNGAGDDKGVHFTSDDIIEKSTSKSRQFANRRWAEYLI